MSSLSLKTVVVHMSITSLMTGTNLQKGGLVHRVPCTKSREKQTPFKQRDMSVMTRVPNFIL